MAKPAKLDRSRPYGTVYGAGVVRYEQDHKPFDATGTELIEPGPRPASATPVDAAPTSDLEGMTMAQLRSRYTDLSGKRARVGITKAQLRQLILDCT